MKTALIIEAATQRKVILTARRASLVAGLNTGRAARRRRLLLQIIGAVAA